MHWLQFATTGFGCFLNRLRFYRDFFILAQVKTLPNNGADALKERLSLTQEKPIFDYDSIENDNLDFVGSSSHIHKAVLLDTLERAFLEKGAQGDKFRNSGMLLPALNLMNDLDNRGSVRRSPDFKDAFVSGYVKTSRFGCRPSLTFPDRGTEFFATEQLLEAHAIIFEAIYLRHFGHPDVAQSRGDMLQETHYTDAIVYAFRELFKDHDDKEFAAVFDAMHPDDFYTSLIVCIEIALDIYFPEDLDLLDFSETDWYPPTRFAVVIEALKSVGFFRFQDVKSRKDAFAYREALVSQASLRTSMDKAPFFLRQFSNFEDLSKPGLNPMFGFGPLSQNIPNQAVMDAIQEFYYQKKMESVCHFLDPVLNLSNDFAPTFTVLYDETDERVANLSKAPVINYENGTFGLADRSRLIAHQLVESSLTTYPIYSAAFDEGYVRFSPGNIAKTINFSGKSVSDFAFEQIMTRSPMNVT
ncbi:MAG: hypothetical protein ABJL67_23945 [Sulfitobacter sp.]